MNTMTSTDFRYPHTNAPEKLQHLCEDYLVRQADRAGFKLLFQESLDFCLDYFTQLTDSDEFVRLDKCLLIQLLQSDRLNVPDELSVLAAISKWSVANQADQQVVSTVRFLLIKEEELERFNDKLLVGLARNINQSSGRTEDNPRTPDRCERLLFTTVGGFLIRYDPVTRTWARVDEIPCEEHGILFPKCGFILAVVGDSLYLLRAKKILRFHLRHRTWHDDVAPMNCPRSCVSAVVLNGNLYALGGFVAKTPMRTVERYDACNNTWHLCAPMREPRTSLDATVLDGRIYVASGGPGSDNTIECYWPHEDTWSYMSGPVSSGWKRRPLGVRSLVSFEGCLYLLDTKSRSVFKYQAIWGAWEKITGYPPMARGLLSSLHALNGKLYAKDRQYSIHVLDQMIEDAVFRWRWHRLETKNETKYHIRFGRGAIYYGRDCADPTKTDGSVFAGGI